MTSVRAENSPTSMFYQTVPQHVVPMCSDFQSSLTTVKQWSFEWQLQISVIKSDIIVIGSGIDVDLFLDDTEPLASVDAVKSLSITLNCSLTFSSHINYIVSRAKRSASLIFRCFNSRHVPSLVNAFKIYVRPMVEYGTPVWSPYMVQSITQLESVHCAARFHVYLVSQASHIYVDRLQILGLHTDEHRRSLADPLMCYKIIHGLVALNFDEFFSFSPNTSLRGHPYKLNKCNRSKYFFSSRIVPIWNSLLVAVVMSENVISFEITVRKFDLSRYLIVPSIIC